MKYTTRILASLALLFSASAFAGSAPTITNACVTFPKAGVARISGMVTDPDWDAKTVGPLVVGICLNGANNVSGVSYVCDVPAEAERVTLVAADAESNYSAAVYADIKLGCTYY